MDLKEGDILGDSAKTHWYYKSKATTVERMIGYKQNTIVLDVGAGSGFFSHHLLTQNLALEAWCVDTSYDTDRDEVHAGKSVYYRRSVDSLKADLVLMMDVLEHVDDDIGLLKEYANKVPIGSTFLITVPAFQFMWSSHDEFLEHKRRYTLKQLESVVSASDLKVIRSAYGFGAVFPIAMLQRFFLNTFQRKSPVQSQLKMHHPIVNATLATICQLELPLVPSNRLFGLTVFCLAKKA
jgi:SAM-dependent methyltransferase